jgi:cobalt-zinc-cadmium resistance protein CzcA
VEGKMFSPLAFTLGYALLGSLILSLTYVPAMCKYLLKKNIKEDENKITKVSCNAIFKGFRKLFDHPKWTLSIFIAALLVCIFRFSHYGSEFLPKLNEGAIYVRATLPNSVNLEESVKLTKTMKAKLMKQFDEIDLS